MLCGEKTRMQVIWFDKKSSQFWLVTLKSANLVSSRTSSAGSVVHGLHCIELPLRASPSLRCTVLHAPPSSCGGTQGGANPEATMALAGAPPIVPWVLCPSVFRGIYEGTRSGHLILNPSAGPSVGIAVEVPCGKFSEASLLNHLKPGCARFMGIWLPHRFHSCIHRRLPLYPPRHGKLVFLTDSRTLRHDLLEIISAASSGRSRLLDFS